MALTIPQAILLQRCLNVALDRIPPLRTDGDLGPRSRAAIGDLQRRLGLADTGGVDEALLTAAETAARERGWQPAVAPGGTPAWLALAKLELGQKEETAPGRDNPRILDYLATMPGLPPQDETPWCACFVAWCLLRAGVEVPPQAAGGPSAAARSWANFGKAADIATAAPGSVVVVFNENRPAHTTASGFHVAFLEERVANGVRLRGGNQNNQVSDAPFAAPAWRIVAARWPG